MLKEWSIWIEKNVSASSSCCNNEAPFALDQSKQFETEYNHVALKSHCYVKKKDVRTPRVIGLFKYLFHFYSQDHKFVLRRLGYDLITNTY